MASTTKRLVILYSAISVVLFLGVLWIVDYSTINLPEKVWDLPIHPYSLLMVFSFFILFLLLQKRMLRYNAGSSVLELVLASTVVSLLSLFIYQLIRQYMVIGLSFPGKLSYIVLSSLIPSIVSAIIATSIALDLKKIKGIWKHLPTVLLLLLFFFGKKYVSTIE